LQPKGPADDGLATSHGRLECILPLPVTLDSAAVSRACTSDPSAVVRPGPHAPLRTSPLPAGDVTAPRWGRHRSPLGTSPLPAGDVTATAAPVPRLQSLSHSLRPRHLAMIAIGGVIGAGLFVGSSVAIATVGPAIIVTY